MNFFMEMFAVDCRNDPLLLLCVWHKVECRRVSCSCHSLMEVWVGHNKVISISHTTTYHHIDYLPRHSMLQLYFSLSKIIASWLQVMFLSKSVLKGNFCRLETLCVLCCVETSKKFCLSKHWVYGWILLGNKDGLV